MLDLSWRNMLLPISVNLCCLDFNHEVSQNYPAVLYSSSWNMLLPISENLCCLDSDHEVYNWICYPIQGLKELLNESPCICIICCILDRKVNRFSQEIFFTLETLPNLFFLSYNTPVLSCKYRYLCLLKTYQFLVIHEWPSVFSKQFVSLLLDSVFLPGH